MKPRKNVLEYVKKLAAKKIPNRLKCSRCGVEEGEIEKGECNHSWRVKIVK